jgi:hypothetical protein
MSITTNGWGLAYSMRFPTVSKALKTNFDQ